MADASEEGASAPREQSEPPDPQRPIPPPLDPNRKRPLLANPFFWGAIAGLLIIPLLRPLLRRVPEPPPVIAQIADFTLLDHDGRAFGSADLKGKVWVADFFFTRCPSICPKLTKAMRKLQDRFDELEVDIRLVSFTVDPEFDQPEQLRAYGKKYGADPKRWTFLTSKAPDEIRRVIIDRFKTHVGDRKTDDNNVMDIAHSGAFGLVDGNGGLRGFYRTDEEGLRELEHRAVSVLLAQED